MTSSDKKLLLKLARDSISARLQDIEPDTSIALHLDDRRGAFVTLFKRGRLRGCIGCPEPIWPLYKAVADSAQSAAFDDPRFPPMRQEELDEVDIDISVLTTPELLEVAEPDDYLEMIRIGADGLIIRGHNRSGLLLPQVAGERGMAVRTFLEAVSQKAGLGQNAWRDLSNKIYRFQAEVFSEEEFS